MSSYNPGYNPVYNYPQVNYPQANLVKYVRVGEIYMRGVAKLYLYSMGQVSVLSAQIDSTPYVSQALSSYYLMKGYNEITVYFSGILNSLKVGERRTVLLTTGDKDVVGIPAVVVG
ncbi:DUF973 family protein [Stygiolobus caldivivus]|uniref:Uncharacterized protein n=1 Tax=Stygiolobus caldivivus TaxID=2824673 RepID=A0A8D5ZGE1_9CREN|nr:DUF973 family protein [Stygiolobus caldivivus]BCU70858.1 hypothetical protein KN1_21550 [Stygiolobus caldivivus]